MSSVDEARARTLLAGLGPTPKTLEYVSAGSFPGSLV
jgi:hypothetical protein